MKKPFTTNEELAKISPFHKSQSPALTFWKGCGVNSPLMWSTHPKTPIYQSEESLKWFCITLSCPLRIRNILSLSIVYNINKIYLLLLLDSSIRSVSQSSLHALMLYVISRDTQWDEGNKLSVIIFMVCCV